MEMVELFEKLTIYFKTPLEYNISIQIHEDGWPKYFDGYRKWLLTITN